MADWSGGQFGNVGQPPASGWPITDIRGLGTLTTTITLQHSSGAVVPNNVAVAVSGTF